MADEENGKYKYAFKTTVSVVFIVMGVVGAVMLYAIPTGVDGQIDESVSKALRVIATIMAAVLGTGGISHE